MIQLVTTPRSEHLGPILELYVRGSTAQQTANILNITKQKVESSLNSFRADYLATLSLKGLIPQTSYQSALDEINQPFFDLLSDPASSLSNEEMLYCAYYVSTGNSLDALTKAGLDVGLEINSQGTKKVLDKNCLLRSELLKRKKNIQEEIRRLQKERSEVVDATKDRILDMHMEYIDQLREEGDPKNKSLIVKLLDQVNKMQGNYTTIIQTSEISADDVMDSMTAIFEAERPAELRDTHDENVFERTLEAQEVTEGDVYES